MRPDEYWSLSRAETLALQETWEELNVAQEYRTRIDPDGSLAAADEDDVRRFIERRFGGVTRS